MRLGTSVRKMALVAAWAGLASGVEAAAVSGRVLGSDGAPIAGATVEGFEKEDARTAGARRVEGKGPTPIATAKAGPDGAFRLEAKAHVSWVQATADGFGPAVATPDESVPTQITLTRAAARRGIVRAGGTPVAGAVVIWSTVNGGEIVTRTDAGGGYEAPDPAEVPGQLSIFHPDYAPGGGYLGSAPSAALDQKLEAGVSLAGRAVDASGGAVPNATVWVDGSWPVARTDAKGAFTIRHASSNWSSVSVRTPGAIGVARRKVGPLLVTLKPERTISGLATDAGTRQPLAGVVVVVETSGGQEAAETDARGRYVLGGLPADTYHPYAGRRGYESGPSGHQLSKGIDLRTALAGRFDVALKRLAQARGRVVDERGQPVEGARVTFGFRDTPNVYLTAPWSQWGFGGDGPFVTGPDGTFTVTVPQAGEDSHMGVFASAERPLIALKHGYAAAQAPLDKARNAPVTITLVKGLPLRGRVTGPDGAPIAGVAVTAAEEGSMGGSLYPTQMILARAKKDAWVRSDEQGRFELRVNPAVHHLLFRKPGYAPRLASGNDPRAGADVEVALGPAAFVRGRVSRADGRGVENAQITVTRLSGTDQESTTTAADGTFELRDLSPGEHQLAATHPELPLQESRVVEAPAADVAIVMGPAVTLRGTVLDSATRQPIPRFDVQVGTDTDGENGWRQAHGTDGSGAFAVEDVPAGIATVTVTAEGYAARELEDLELSASATPDPIEVLLDPDAPIRGRITGPSGESVSDATVTVDGNHAPIVSVDDDGEYEVRGLAAGPVKLTFSADGYVSEERSADTRQNPRLDVTLKRGLALKGVVVQNGAGVPDAMVGAATSTRGAGYVSTQTDDQGRFTIEGLVPGRYTVTARAMSKGMAKLEDVDVESAGPIRLALEKGSTAVLTGRVVGLPAGDLGTAMVMAFNEETGQSMQSGIDAARTFRMEDAPAGSVTVRAYAASLEGGSARNSRPLRLTIAPGSETEAVVEFGDDATVNGVVTREGAPVPHVMVSFAEESGMGATGRTDARGAYQVAGLAPGQYLVHVMGDRVAYRMRYTVTGSAELDIDVTGGTLTGRVVSANGGGPVDDVTIALFRLGENENRPDTTLSTGAQGTFQERGLREGRFRLVTSKEGFGQEVREVELASGGSADVPIELSPAGGVGVTVVDARDQRPLEAIVVVRDLGRRIVANRHSGADENGVLNIPLADGSYLLSTSASGYGTVTVPVTSPRQGLRLALTPGGRLVIEAPREIKGRARLVRPDGEEYVQCWCNGIGEIQLKGRRTTVENVTPGSYTLEIVDSPEALRPRALVVQEGQTTTVSLE